MEKEVNEEIINYKNYCERRRRDLKKKHAHETKQHPKNLKQQQMNIHKLYKHQYNTQNKQYKSYKEQIMNQTPKDHVKEKLEQIKDEQNRKFSLLYEHYKTNLEAVYQQQSLKLTANQQLEQDQLNDDLEKQMHSLLQLHAQRKQSQADSFARECEALECERMQRFAELEHKIKCEVDEFDANSRARLSRLRDEQLDFIERFDRECLDKFGINLSGAMTSASHSHVLSSASFSNSSSSNNSTGNSSSNNNRHSVVYNFDHGLLMSQATPVMMGSGGGSSGGVGPANPNAGVASAGGGGYFTTPECHLDPHNPHHHHHHHFHQQSHMHTSASSPISKTNRLVY